MKTFMMTALMGFISAVSLAAAERASIADLGWLAGTWLSEPGERSTVEQWMKPDGGTMLGMSRTVAKGRTIEFEFLLIRSDADGGLVYVAKPANQPEATFKLARLSEREVIFENPEHDFPQRIMYSLKEDGRLLAAIEGMRKGKVRRIEYSYRAAK